MSMLFDCPPMPLSDTCKTCGQEVGQGMAQRTLEIYGKKLCVPCGVKYGKWH